MEPHMIDNELFSFLFVIWINHVGFRLLEFFINLLRDPLRGDPLSLRINIGMDT
jgi:hypothetical protein